jgi:SAM-dependent methyltransferase
VHNSIMDFVKHYLKPEEVSGKRVLEIGSLNVNGSVRDVIQGTSMYIGIDIRGGTDVDIVMSGEHLYSVFAPESFDVVLCIETLEHVFDWRQVIRQIKYVLRPNGVVLLTTRSPGYKLHGYPEDFWRFTLTDMTQIFSDMRPEALIADPEFAGVLVKVRKILPVILDEIDVAGITEIEIQGAIDEDTDRSTL